MADKQLPVASYKLSDIIRGAQGFTVSPDVSGQYGYTIADSTGLTTLVIKEAVTIDGASYKKGAYHIGLGGVPLQGVNTGMSALAANASGLLSKNGGKMIKRNYVIVFVVVAILVGWLIGFACTRSTDTKRQVEGRPLNGSRNAVEAVNEQGDVIVTDANTARRKNLEVVEEED